jgi:salicylate hydroxylase
VPAGDEINGITEPQYVDADVILAADGVRSKARGAMLQRKGEVDSGEWGGNDDDSVQHARDADPMYVVVDTGQAAYRIMVRRSMINEDPELLPFFTGSHSYRWIGEKRHIIVSSSQPKSKHLSLLADPLTRASQAYPIDSHDLFNMSTAHPDRRFVEADSWTATGSKKEMLEVFHDFCPRVQKLLSLVPEGDVLEWKLRVHEPLSTWVDHNVALVGDACHPTLPHLAQGAAQAVEDAAVLGVVLSKITDRKDINKALQVYQAVRKPRADWAVMTAAANGKGLHLGAGKDKDARDAAFKAADKKGGANPDKQIDR